MDGECPVVPVLPKKLPKPENLFFFPVSGTPVVDVRCGCGWAFFPFFEEFIEAPGGGTWGGMPLNDAGLVGYLKSSRESAACATVLS